MAKSQISATDNTNPNGIHSFSPGVDRKAIYPGSSFSSQTHNPNGVASTMAAR